MPVELPKASHFTVIQLWDPNKNKITVENTRRTVTQTVQKVENIELEKHLVLFLNSTSEFLFEFRIYNNTFIVQQSLQENHGGQKIHLMDIMILMVDCKDQLLSN